MVTRRKLLIQLTAILAAPSIVRAASLMPVRRFDLESTPSAFFRVGFDAEDFDQAIRACWAIRAVAPDRVTSWHSRFDHDRVSTVVMVRADPPMLTERENIRMRRYQMNVLDPVLSAIGFGPGASLSSISIANGSRTFLSSAIGFGPGARLTSISISDPRGIESVHVS